MSDRQGVRLDADEYARTAISKASAISWPFPVDRRLDQLVELANQAGANTKRHELAAALVAAGPSDPDKLLQAVIDWRKSRVRQVVLGVSEAAEIVELPRFRPGRRRASGA